MVPSFTGSRGLQHPEPVPDPHETRFAWQPRLLSRVRTPLVFAFRMCPRPIACVRPVLLWWSLSFGFWKHKSADHFTTATPGRPRLRRYWRGGLLICWGSPHTTLCGDGDSPRVPAARSAVLRRGYPLHWTRTRTSGAGICVKGRGAGGAVTEQLHGTAKAVWGGTVTGSWSWWWGMGMPLGSSQGRGVGAGGWGSPPIPPPFKRFPAQEGGRDCGR